MLIEAAACSSKLGGENVKRPEAVAMLMSISVSLLDYCKDIAEEVKRDLRYVPCYIVCAVYIKGMLCSRLNLRCTDVPVFTSNTMPFFSYDRDDKYIRRVWNFLKRVISGNTRSIQILSHGNASFFITANVVKGSSYVLRGHNISIEKIDCHDDCKLTTNTLMLYVYLEGFVGNNHLKVNLVYLIKRLFDSGYGELAEDLTRLTIGLLKLKQGLSNDVGEVTVLMNRVVDELKDFRDLLKDAMIDVTRDQIRMLVSSAMNMVI